MIANMGTAKIAPGTPHIQYQKIRDRITATGLMVNRFASSSGVTISPSSKRAAGNKAAQAGPLLINPTARKRTIPQNGPRIGTKFKQNATTPQSTGPGTSHSHITPAVAQPTAVLITVIVNKYADRSRSTRSVISTASRLSANLGKTSTNRRKKVSPNTSRQNRTRSDSSRGSATVPVPHRTA